MAFCTEIPASLDNRQHKSAPHYEICRFDSIGSKRQKCWVALPNYTDPALPPLLAIHGIFRDANGMLNAISGHMPKANRIIIAPVFDATNWRSYQRLIGRHRADLALLNLLNTIKLSGLTDSRSFDLLGYSGGAQFAHRFALFYPHLINRLMLCSAGWYTFPTDEPYPYGLATPETKLSGFQSLGKINLKSFLNLPIDVFVGEHDTEVDPNTRTGDYIDRQQGRNRLERAVRWVDALQSVSQTYGFQANVKLTVLKGCGHDFRECVRQGNLVERLFSRMEDAYLRQNHLETAFQLANPIVDPSHFFKGVESNESA